MNCKPGDLAVVVRAYVAENLGKVCRVIGPSRVKGWDWELEFPHPVLWSGGAIARDGRGQDWQLRPIRNNDGEDETLTWAGKPSDIKEPA
jgi:hypothetical protein